MESIIHSIKTDIKTTLIMSLVMSLGLFLPWTCAQNVTGDPVSQLWSMKSLVIIDTYKAEKIKQKGTGCSIVS